MTADPAAVRASLADATPDVFWTDRPERPSPRASLTGAGHRADLVVVGGGFTGLWAAIQAKEGDPSRDVVVLERGRFVAGGPGATAGSWRPRSPTASRRGWPAGRTRSPRSSGLPTNRAGLEATLAAYDIDADYHVPGEITMALSEHQVESVREGYELHRDHGVRSATWMPLRLAPGRLTALPAGFLDPTIGLVDPASASGAWPPPPSGSACACTRTPP